MLLDGGSGMSHFRGHWVGSTFPHWLPGLDSSSPWLVAPVLQRQASVWGALSYLGLCVPPAATSLSLVLMRARGTALGHSTIRDVPLCRGELLHNPDSIFIAPSRQHLGERLMEKAEGWESWGICSEFCLSAPYTCTLIAK